MIAERATSLGVNSKEQKLHSLKNYLRTVLVILLAVVVLVPSTSAFASYSTGYPNTWKNSGNQAKDITQIALTQVGYEETGDNHTKYNAWYYGSDINVAWCAIFISWCANQAGVSTSVIAKNAMASGFSTSNMSSNSYGCPAYAFGTTTAKAGDIIYVGTGDWTGHVGLVYAVDNDYVYTVEGNSSDKVTKVKYSASTGHRVWGDYVSSARIIFYARPNYSGSSKTTTTTTTESTTTTTTENSTTTTTTAENATTTTTEASSSVTTEASSTTVTATAADGTVISVNGVSQSAVTVNADGTVNYPTGTYTLTDNVNILSKADQNSSIVGTVKKGTVVNVMEVSGTYGSVNVNGLAGWISLEHAKVGGLDTSVDADDTVSGTSSTEDNTTYYIGTYELNTTMTLRSEADKSSTAIGYLKEGTTVTVTKLSGRFGYVNVNGKEGWVSLKYATLVNITGEYTQGVYRLDDTMTLRSDPDTSSNAIGYLANGTTVTVTKISGRFGYVTVNEKSGWVSLKYATQLSCSSPYSTGTYKLNDTMNLREEADKNSKDLGDVASGTTVEASVICGRFAYVTVNGQSGWVSLIYAEKQN